MLKTETLNLRVSAEFKRRLIEEAKKEKRSVTNYIETAIIELWTLKTSDTTPTGKKKGG
jgi:predicted HicB family RNase H-like nuclease